MDMIPLSFADFVGSDSWVHCLRIIQTLNPQVADAIKNHSIRDVLTPDWDYDLKEFLTSFPEEIQVMIYEDHQLHNSVCALAKAYVDFCQS